MKRYLKFFEGIRSIYGEGEILLHRPLFIGNEYKYLNKCLDSNYVSSAGTMIAEFERAIANTIGVQFAVATSSGTSALHVALLAAGVKPGDEVLTQSLTFVATGNSILQAGATPVFVDVSADTMGMCPISLRKWLSANAKVKNDVCINIHTNMKIAACMPMHTFGNPVDILSIREVCREYHLILVEDSAEALGSSIGTENCGSFGDVAALSFNGNKIITTGGGGMLLTNDVEIAKFARHVATTAKIPHAFNFYHDMLGYNYRMPNLNAALGLAQVEKLDYFLNRKEEISNKYSNLCASFGFKFFVAPKETQRNNWLNAMIVETKHERDEILNLGALNGLQLRPAWEPLHTLPHFRHFQTDSLDMTRYLADRIVNLPSSVPE